jgi:hypothetical protein
VPTWQRVFDDANTEHESIDTEAYFDYVTLLNLRNSQKLPDERIITEQVLRAHQADDRR